MYIDMPKDVASIIKKCEENGYEAYIVGGCVRDSILGIKPKDWDITTNALPSEIKEIFDNTVDTGIEHGTVSIIKNKIAYEITTYRIDGTYTDCRRPDSVTFSSSLYEDLRRRDFTINAMAYSDKDGIIDMFDGLKDLKDKKIRCVGNALDRFNEDALRMLRAVRFSAQLDYEIEESTYNAIKTLAKNLKKVSKERVFVELTKTLCSACPKKVYMLFDTKLNKYIGENFDKINFKDFDEKFLDRLNKLDNNKHIRYAVFLSVVDTKTAQKILKELKSDNDTIKKVTSILSCIFVDIKNDKIFVKNILSKVGKDIFYDICHIKEFVFKEKGIVEVQKTLKEILDNQEAYNVSMLSVGGSELIELGIKQGKQIGIVLKELLLLVIENPLLNNKKDLLDYSKKFL